MHEIRKNNEVEEDIISMTFKIEPIIYILYILGILICVGVILAGFLAFKGRPDSLIFQIAIISIGFIFLISNLTTLVFKAIGIKRSKVTVSNQRIYGQYGLYIVTRTFSYKLDEIDNVEVGNYLGSHSIVINFVDGKGPRLVNNMSYGTAPTGMDGDGIFKLRYVQNYQEVYDALVKILLSVKTITNLKTDIEMAKVDTESRKAEAMEKIAKNITAAGTVHSEAQVSNNNAKGDYIDEIKRLKGLLDEGIITQEEFDREKKEILDNNHK